MTIPEEDKLKSIWQNLTASTSTAPEDLIAIAEWLDQGCPEDDRIDAMMAQDAQLRDIVSDMRLHPADSSHHFIAPETREELLERVLAAAPADAADSMSRNQPAVLGSIGIRFTAAAAAIAVAALGFSFGRVAAPATNEATNDFVAVVTFDMLTEDDHLNLILTASSLAIDPTTEGTVE